MLMNVRLCKVLMAVHVHHHHLLALRVKTILVKSVLIEQLVTLEWHSVLMIVIESLNVVLRVMDYMECHHKTICVRNELLSVLFELKTSFILLILTMMLV